MALKKVSTTIKYVVPGTQPPIFLAGSFSTPEWQPVEMQYTTDEKNEHEFYREVEVEQGKEYQYKFRIGLGDWWILNEGSPTATDNIGNRNNILLVPHSEEQETTEELQPETETEKGQMTEETISEYLPLANELSPVLNPVTPFPKNETTSTDENKYLRQFDGSVDGGKHAREALPAAIETLTPVTAPLSEDIHQKEPEPEPEIPTEKGLRAEEDSPEDTTKPLTTESVKESALEIKDEWFGQDSTEAAQSSERASDNVSSDSITGQTKDEEKRNSSHSNSSETSDPVNQSDHTDDSFVFVPQHDSTCKEEGQSTTAKPTEHETSEDHAVAKVKASQYEDVSAVSIPAEDKSFDPHGIEKSQDSTCEKSNDQTPQEIDNSDTSKIVIGLQQSFDGTTAPAAPLPVTPFVVGNRELGDDGGPTREVLSNAEGPIITVQPSTPGPASLSTIETSKQLGDSASTAVDDGSANQVAKRNKQATPTSGRANSPSSMRTFPRDAKPNKGLVRAFLHLVFVEWIGKLFGKLWSGFKRQPSNE